MSDLPPPSPPPNLPPPGPTILPAPVEPRVESNAEAASPPPPPPAEAAPADGANPHAENAEDATLGLVMYLLPLLGLSSLRVSTGIPMLLAALAPIALWLYKRDQSRYLDATGKEVVNFNICAVVGFTALQVLQVVGSWIWLGGLFRFVSWLAMLAWVVVTVISAYNANGGKFYRFPFNYPLVK